MGVQVRIPAVMRSLVDGQAEVSVEATSVRALLQELGRRFPDLAPRLLDERGELLRHLTVFVNGEDVRFRDDLDTALRDGDSVAIVPAIAGGG